MPPSHPTTIRTAVAVCAIGHTIVGVRVNDDSITDDEAIMLAKETVAIGVESRAINPWCELCGNRKWHYTLRRYASEAEYKKAEDDELRLREMTGAPELDPHDTQFLEQMILAADQRYQKKKRHMRN